MTPTARARRCRDAGFPAHLIASQLARCAVPCEDAARALLDPNGAALPLDLTLTGLLASDYSIQDLGAAIRTVHGNDHVAFSSLIASPSVSQFILGRMAAVLLHPDGFHLPPTQLAKLLAPFGPHRVFSLLTHGCGLPTSEAAWTIHHHDGLALPFLDTCSIVAATAGMDELFVCLATDPRFGFSPGSAIRFLHDPKGMAMHRSKATRLALCSGLPWPQVSEAIRSPKGLGLNAKSFAHDVGEGVPSSELLDKASFFLHSPDGYHLPPSAVLRLLYHPHGGNLPADLLLSSALSPTGLSLSVPTVARLAHSPDGLGFSIPHTAKAIFGASNLGNAWECLVSQESFSYPPHQAVALMLAEDGLNLGLPEVIRTAAHHPTVPLSHEELVHLAIAPEGIRLSLPQTVHLLGNPDIGNVPHTRLVELLAFGPSSDHNILSVIQAVAHPEGLNYSPRDCALLLAREDGLHLPLPTVACILAHQDGLRFTPTEVATLLYASSSGISFRRQDVLDALQFGCGIDSHSALDLLDQIMDAEGDTPILHRHQPHTQSPQNTGPGRATHLGSR